MELIDVEQLARKVGRTQAYIKQILNKSKKCGAAMAVLLNKESKGLIDPAALRPDIFGTILDDRQRRKQKHNGKK